MGADGDADTVKERLLRVHPSVMAGGAVTPVPTVAMETWNPAVPAAELMVTVQLVADPGAMLLGLHMKPVRDCPKARALREDRNNAVDARRSAANIFITF